VTRTAPSTRVAAALLHAACSPSAEKPPQKPGAGASAVRAATSEAFGYAPGSPFSPGDFLL
jgi:hypothetical protein